MSLSVMRILIAHGGVSGFSLPLSRKTNAVSYSGGIGGNVP